MDQISSLRQCKYVVRWQPRQRLTWNGSRGLEGISWRSRVWTKKQQVVSLSTAESDLYAAVKIASEGLRTQSVAKGLAIARGLNLHLDASAMMCLFNRRGLGKAKHVDMQNLWMQEASNPKRFVAKKVGTNVDTADLMTKPLLGPKIEQLMKIMGFKFVGQSTRQEELYGMRLVRGSTDVKLKAKSLAAATAKSKN